VRKIVPDERLRLALVQVGWDEAVPARLREVAGPGSMHGTTLVVHVVDNQWLHELTYLRTDLLASLQRACPEAGVTALRLRVGTVLQTRPQDLREPDRAPGLATEPAKDTVLAIEAVSDPDLKQIVATARVALCRTAR
jgi:predicted nucleic acid-binding Zn ribbon protein